jgi:hypothetical protein
VAALMDAVPAGSYLALSHMGSDLLTADTQQGIKNVISSSGQQQYFYRTREQVARRPGSAAAPEPEEEFCGDT